MFPFVIREDKVDEFLEKCKFGWSKEYRQELIEHSKNIRSEGSDILMSECNVNPPVISQSDYVSNLERDNYDLRNKLSDKEREENRLRYMATGYAGLIAMTKDAELIAKAAQIAVDADKQY